MSYHIYMPFMPTFLKFLNYTKTLLIIPSKECKSIMTGHPRKRKKSTMTGHPTTKYLEVFGNKPFRWARLPFCSFRHFEMDTTARVNWKTLLRTLCVITRYQTSMPYDKSLISLCLKSQQVYLRMLFLVKLFQLTVICEVFRAGHQPDLSHREPIQQTRPPVQCTI